MATTALGKSCAAPAVSAALFQQDAFYAYPRRFSFSSRLYFHDDQGNSLAFVRNPRFAYNQEIRVFSDPTMSFELLRVRSVAKAGRLHEFHVTDSVNRQPVGAIMRLVSGGLRCQEWVLLDSTGQESAFIREDSFLLGQLRRCVTELIPQSYSFFIASRRVGNVTRNHGLFSRAVCVDLRLDSEKRLDRRLLAAAVVLLMVPGPNQHHLQ